MTNPIGEGKTATKAQIEFSSITSYSEPPSLNFLDLMMDAPADAAPTIGKLESKPIGDNIERSAEKKDSVKTVDLQLTQTERLILNRVESGVTEGSAAGIQEGLQALNEQPQESRDRVMRELAQRLQDSSDSFIGVSWESGVKSGGQSFTRLHLNKANDNSKSSGHTTVTIGSDGPGMATIQPGRWDSARELVSADQALSTIRARTNVPPKPRTK